MALPDRSLLDAAGCLVAGATLAPPTAGYVVFGQALPPPFDLPTLRKYASRFFDAKVGLSVEKKAPVPPRDLAFVMVHHASIAGEVPVEARAATEADLALARRAEETSRTSGLASLAARCPRVFVLHAESAEEPACLLVACLLAGTSLGPVVDLAGTAIFGVKSGRERLERALARR